MENPQIDPLSVDALIARRLPAYLAELPPERLGALHRALVRQQEAQHQLQQVLGPVTPLEAFAEQLLNEAMKLVSESAVDVRGAQLHSVWRQPIAAPVASLPPAYHIHRSSQSLLAAALHNFSEEETRATAFHGGTRLVDQHGQEMNALKPEQFAWLCRQLDIGGQYQRYLQSHFRPQAAEARKVLDDLLEEVQRSNLEAAVRIAQANGELDDLSYRQLLPLMSAKPRVPSTPAVLKPRQLYLLGKRIVGVLALEIRADASATAPLQGVIAWVPGDRLGAVTRHASWAALYQALAVRLREPGYLGFFERFIGQADREAFGALVISLLAKPGAGPIELDGRALDFTGEVFSHLRQGQVDKILADARVLAVVTDDEDRLSRSKRLQGYLDAGLDLLNLAALFVPGLGLAMLGVAALQMADEVYEGYQDWAIGDRKGALDHLFGVAEALAVNAVLVAGGVAVGKVLERVGFVDDLVPVTASDGQARLCDPNLESYRVAHGSDDAVGAVIDKPAGQQLRLHEGSYAVHKEAASGNWQIRHPQRPDAARVTLRENGSGGWQHALESPQQWQGSRLLRRLASEFADAPEPVLRDVMHSTGFDQARLRRLQVEGAAAPARLRDAMERHRWHARLPALDSVAFEAQLAAAQQAPGPHALLLRRDFPGLSARCAEEIVEQASEAQRTQMLASSRVPLALAEQARWAVRDSRLDRACAGLCQAQAANADSERLALGLIDDLSPWAQGTRVELREGSVEGSLRAQAGSADASDVRRVLRLEGGYQALDAQAQPLAAATPQDSLIKALLLHIDEAQRLRLEQPQLDEQQLTRLLLERAAGQREHAAQLIGLAKVGGAVRPLTRLGDGRLGYPLSGRPEGSRRALRRALWQVYPAFSGEDMRLYILEQQQLNVDLWSHVQGLQRQLTELEQCLAAWHAESAAGPVRAARKRVAKHLLLGWRRQSLVMAGDLTCLHIEGEAVGQLPALPAAVRFDHVQSLTLRGLALEEAHDDFLQRFGNLRHLSLSDNRLSQIPGALQAMGSLQRLELADNRITLGPDSNRRLGALRQLRELNLNRNALVAPPNLSGFDQLRRVSLAGTGLTQVPPTLPQLLALEGADLRENRITTLDDSFFNQPARNVQRVFLHDNPLDVQSQARLSAFQQADAERVRNLGRHAASSREGSGAWLQALPADERLLREQQWNSLSHEPRSQYLFRLLADLRETEDYLVARKSLGLRVWAVIDAAAENTQLRERLFELAASPTSCSDSVALNFSQLEVLAWVHQSTAGVSGVAAEPGLLRLARSLFRLDEVDRAAAEDIAERIARQVDVDEIEVRLAYRVGLAKTLDLPGQPERMRYAGEAELSSARLLATRGRVLTAERTPRLASSISGRDFWRAHLRQAYAERFDQAQAPHHAELEALDARRDTLRDDAYLQQLGSLMSAFDASSETLITELTAQSLARHPQ